MKYAEYISYLLENKLYESSRYLGSCVDVGNFQDSGDDEDYMDICDIFSDATEMSQRVWDVDLEDDELADKYFSELSKDEFFKYIEPLESMFRDDLKFVKKITKGGKLKYFYDTYPNINSISQAKIFYIYNEKDGVHYFFKRTI